MQDTDWLPYYTYTMCEMKISTCPSGRNYVLHPKFLRVNHRFKHIHLTSKKESHMVPQIIFEVLVICKISSWWILSIGNTAVMTIVKTVWWQLVDAMHSIYVLMKAIGWSELHLSFDHCPRHIQSSLWEDARMPRAPASGSHSPSQSASRVCGFEQELSIKLTQKKNDICFTTLTFSNIDCSFLFCASHSHSHTHIYAERAS